MSTAGDYGRGRPVDNDRRRAVLYGFLSLAIAGTMAYFVWWVVVRYETEILLVAQAESGAIVVATRELRPGAVISPEDVTLGRAAAKPGTYTTLDEVLGQTVGDRILAGEPVRYERLTIGGADLLVNEVIDPGARAVSIQVDQHEGLSSLLRPGFFVDVMLTARRDIPGQAPDWVTETILQTVRVIAVNDAVSSGPAVIDLGISGLDRTARTMTITLEVEPTEAKALALASSRGRLHLALRARDDLDVLPPSGPLHTNQLVGVPDSVQSAQARRVSRKVDIISRAAPPPRTESMEIIRGGQITVETFDENGQRMPAGNRR